MAVYCLALSHSGIVLASGSYDSTTILWNMDTYEQLFVLHGEGGYVNALDFSADDQRLFTGSNDGKHLIVVAFVTHTHSHTHRMANIFFLITKKYIYQKYNIF